MNYPVFEAEDSECPESKYPEYGCHSIGYYDSGESCDWCGNTAEHPVAAEGEQEGLDALRDAMAAVAETEGTVESCPSCSAGNDGGGYPCDCPTACGARYCQHPTETTDTTKEN